MRFLVADDHAVVRKGVCALLGSYEGLCIEAANGQEAVNRCIELPFDLVILDVTMPVLDGFSAAKQIRQALPKVPILMLSMHEGYEVARVARSIGAQGFVTKSELAGVPEDAVDVLLRGGTFFAAIDKFEGSGQMDSSRTSLAAD